MTRHLTRYAVDRRVFQQTAYKTRSINVKPISLRGGIRL